MMFDPAEAIETFRAFAREQHGVLVPENPKLGRIGLCPVEGKKPSNRAGRYRLHLDGIPAGWTQNWTCEDRPTTWCLGKKSDYSPADWAAYQDQVKSLEREREEHDARRSADVEALCVRVYGASTKCTSHPYLDRKDAKAVDGLRATDREWEFPRDDGEPPMKIRSGALIVPAFSSDGKLRTLQFIYPDGAKLFPCGAKVRGHFVIGKPGDVVAAAESYATGWTIHAATGYAVYVSFGSGNMLSVTQEAQRQHPGARIVVCGDDDWQVKGNPGKTRAVAAAKPIGAAVWVPEFGPERGEKDTDANDLAALHGLPAVKRQIEAVLAQATATETASVVIPPRISDDAVAVWSKPLPPALPTPFAPLNRLLGDGLSGLTTLVAPTGVGKTGLALLLGRHAAQSMPVLYVSTELGIRQSYARIAGQILRRPWYPLFRGAALTGQVVASAAAGLDFRCLVFTSLTETLATADAIVAHDGKAPFVILDFLQGAARDATVDRRAAVSAACDAMLQWCRVDEGRVALMVSSTARAHYATDDRVARDLVGTAKESGDVEFAATAVLSLRTEECPLDGSTVGQIHVAKSRFGTVGIVGVVFEGATGEFRCDERQSLSEIERAAYDAIAAGAETKDAVRIKLKGSNEAKTAAVRSLRMRGLISTNPYRVIHVSEATETVSNDIEQRRTRGPDADPPPKQVTFADGEHGSGPTRPRTGSTVRVRPPIGADTDPPESPERGNPDGEGEVS